MMITSLSRARLAALTDPDALKWRAAVIAAGGPVSDAQKRRVSTLIGGLKKSGVWSTLDRLWLFAAENSAQALMDLKARAAATPVNNPTFTANRGYKGNASTQYIDTGFNAASGANNYVQNSASFGCWIETAQTSSAAPHRQMGNDDTNYGFISQIDTTSYGFGINAVSPLSYVFSTQTGSWMANRTASNAQALFQNGISVAANAAASAALANRNFWVLGNNNAGVLLAPTDARIGAAHAGASMSAAQAAAFYAAMRIYIIAVGVA